MIWVAASIVIQILCVIHVYQTGRNQMWGLVILFFSLLGCTAYFAFEIMPELFGTNSPQAVRRRLKQQRDPFARLKSAELALAQVDTAANRISLGEAMVDMGAHGEAVDQFRRALDHMHGRDPRIEQMLASALFHDRQPAEALTIVERLDTPGASSEADRLRWLKAIILADLERKDEAAGIFAEVVPRLRDDEANCHYAALLLELNRRAEARAVLEEVEGRVKQRAAGAMTGDAHMYDWAARELKTLRG